MWGTTETLKFLALVNRLLVIAERPEWFDTPCARAVAEEIQKTLDVPTMRDFLLRFLRGEASESDLSDRYSAFLKPL